MTEKTLPEQACVYQRSGDGLKVQGDSKSINLIRTALRSHEEVLPELCGRLAKATNTISRLVRERDELLDALIPLANASMPDERALISDEDQERAAALVAKMEPREDDR